MSKLYAIYRKLLICNNYFEMKSLCQRTRVAAHTV